MLAYEHYLLLLKRFQAWRLGEDERTLEECGLTLAMITEIIEWAIKNLERVEDDGK
jgi:hypothetical protein